MNKDNELFKIKNGVLTKVKKENITEAVIPEGVTEIEKEAFNGCSNLKSITIPNSVTKIGKSAFRGCKSLTNVTIPKDLKFTENPFIGCTSLKSLTTHEGEEIPLPN